MNQDHYIQLMYQKLSGDISPIGEKELQTWLEADAENALLWRQIEAAWKASEGYQSDIQLDLDAEFATLLEKRGGTEARRRIPRRTRMNRTWSIAAGILLFLFAGLMYFMLQNTNGETNTIQYAATEDKEKLELSDGTIVSLQKGAILTYPEKFTQNKRPVTLQGTAFFDVTHNPKQPFEITTDIGKVQVLGTSFYLSSKDKAQKMELQVVTGKVKMTAKGLEESLIVEAGEQAVADVVSNKISKVVAVSLGVSSWHRKDLAFSDVPLQEIVEDIEKIYDVRIEVESPTLQQCPFTATFESKAPLAEILFVIEQVFEMKLVKKSEKSYTLQGGTCD
ncbi:MAG: FecR family protein [Chitinophagales bacterium]